MERDPIPRASGAGSALPDASERSGRRAAVFGIALALVFGGGLLAWWIQTDGGAVEIHDVRFPGDDGFLMSGLLYVPPGATAETPAPGVLAVHGYINSRETQSGFAIELARRGFVVLALDQTGHGYSEPPAFAHGLGGPAGLRFLRSLDIVDGDEIGLEGHSMGGTAIQAAAAAYPDGYRSMVPVGASVPPRQTTSGEPLVHRNLAVVFSTWDEFSELMWSTEVPSEVGGSERMMELFGTEEPVVPGRVYGDPAHGTARVFYQPVTTHPGDHLSTAAIGHVVDWMQTTLDGETPLPAEDQVWYWKEIGTLLAFLGMILAVFPVGSWLLDTAPFASLSGAPAESRAAEGSGWWIAAAATSIIPVATYFQLNRLGADLLGADRVWPQSITNGIMFWAVVNALITLVLLSVWHVTRDRDRRAGPIHYGLAAAGGRNGRRILRSLGLAACVAGFCYLLLAISDFLFQVDFRFWVVALKPMSTLQLRSFLAYLLPFTLFFVVLGAALHGQLRRPELGRAGAMTLNAVLLAAGFAALLLVQYVPLLAGGTMPLGEPLMSIVAFQFVPLLALVGLVSTYFFRKTGSVYPGAFFNGIFVTWYIVAGQATHVALG